jgi:hypothetical protein
MCFSAPVSFAVSAVLLPVGALAVNFALRNDRRYLALAAFPLLFGIQQAFEGWLWLALEHGTDLRAAALGFLFFAYLLWPVLVPLAADCVEPRAGRQRLFRGFALVGLLFGLSLYLPLLIRPDWLMVTISGQSILYEPILLYDGYVPRTAVRGFYAVIVATPLLFSTVASLRLFGILILLSVAVSALFFLYAFVSIWCFFAAVLSLYIVDVLNHSRYHTDWHAVAGSHRTTPSG